MLGDAVGGKVAAYFECYDCESKRKRRKILFYALLGCLVAAAWLFGEFISGRLRP